MADDIVAVIRNPDGTIYQVWPIDRTSEIDAAFRYVTRHGDYTLGKAKLLPIGEPLTIADVNAASRSDDKIGPVSALLPQEDTTNG